MLTGACLLFDPLPEFSGRSYITGTWIKFLIPHLLNALLHSTSSHSRFIYLFLSFTAVLSINMAPKPAIKQEPASSRPKPRPKGKGKAAALPDLAASSSTTAPAKRAFVDLVASKPFISSYKALAPKPESVDISALLDKSEELLTTGYFSHIEKYEDYWRIPTYAPPDRAELLKDMASAHALFVSPTLVGSVLFFLT